MFIRSKQSTCGPRELRTLCILEIYIVNAVDEATLVKKNSKIFDTFCLININYTLINSGPNKINHAVTKNIVRFSTENIRNKRDSSVVFRDQDNEVDKNKSTKLDCITVNRCPIPENELSNKI